MSIQLTERAAKRVARQLAERGSGLGLRLGIKSSGCSGFAYTLDYADAVEPEDVVFESHGAQVVVRREHLLALEGVTVDFRREGLNEVFRFDNPNAEALCGCGESFSLENTGT
jgi:iron-sulfur cluster assembly protein